MFKASLSADKSEHNTASVAVNFVRSLVLDLFIDWDMIHTDKRAGGRVHEGKEGTVDMTVRSYSIERK